MSRFPFTRRWKPDLTEIHQYTLDLERITLLRDKTPDPEEKAGYDIAIHVMQEVLIRLNTPPRKLRKAK